MDSIFDDDSEGVGSIIDAYCPTPRCKADTNHTIVTMYEDEIRRVQCVVCGDVHAYRKPRGDAYDEALEASTARPARRKRTWEEAMARTNEKEMGSCRPYSIRDSYEDGDIVSHPTFHVGFVTELLPDNKVEITFRDERRILVHNRSDLATQMPAVAEMPAPREEKKKKSKKRKEALGDEAPLPVLSKKALAEMEATAEKAAKEKLLSERRRVAEKLKADTPSVKKTVKKKAAAKKPAPAKEKAPAKAAKPAKKKAVAKKPGKKPTAKRVRTAKKRVAAKKLIKRAKR
jgi:hypothetical protein